MDGWNAPQWADFDASVRSDIDEYFNVEHEELESGAADDLQYHSCPSTPNSKKGIAKSPHKPPESGSIEKCQGLTSRMNNLQISDKKFLTDKLSMTPRSCMLRKACSKPSGSSTPQVPKGGSATNDKVGEAGEGLSDDTEKIVEDTQDATLSVEVVEILEPTDSDDDDNAEQNCTLLAAEGNVDVSPDRIKGGDFGPAVEMPRSERTERVVEPALTSVIDKGVTTPGVRDETAIPDATSGGQRCRKTSDETSEARSRAAAPKPSNRTGRKNPYCRPTVLTSHARRQSTSKYRRASNKYVSLAEAVSKFQNGTPERFRSIHKKDAKTAGTAGALQKVKHALKLTCATSPILRCKYRSRLVSVPNQEEREMLMIEEIRKNRAKAIKQSVPNAQRQSKNIVALSKSISKVKKARIDEPPKEVVKPTSQRKAFPDLAKLTKDGSEATAADGDTASRSKSTMTRPKPGSEGMQKSASVADPLSLSRRTMMNPPKAPPIVNKTAGGSCALSLSRRTMANPSKSSLKIDKKPTTIADSFSETCKTPMNPPGALRKIDAKLKSALESTSFTHKTKDASILSTSILPESVRKHTPCKKTVPTVVSTEEGPSIKDVEILHFGIPVGANYKKITEAVPFSFQSHKKKMQSKKEELKSRQVEEEKRTKPFQARPVPSYVTKSSSNGAKLANKPLVRIDAPFSFQRRNEITLKKKKELFDQVVQREKQARIFHAKPAPKFKPVFVRGASSENLRSNNLIEKDKKISKETRQRGLSQGSINDNRENTAPNLLTTNQPKLKDTLMNLKLKKSVVK